MGLDMYLEKMNKISIEKHREISESYDRNYDEEEVKTIRKNAQNLNVGDVAGTFKGVEIYVRGSENYKFTSFVKEVGYWRKANHIHKWFVSNVQNGYDDCGEYEVSKEQLLELKELCKTVLSDNKKASELLPTGSGFFFGSTEYDKYYFEDLESTIEIIDNVLATTEFENEMIIYTSSW